MFENIIEDIGKSKIAKNILCLIFGVIFCIIMILLILLIKIVIMMMDISLVLILASIILLAGIYSGYKSAKSWFFRE